jgi:hypothetical protein
MEKSDVVSGLEHKSRHREDEKKGIVEEGRAKQGGDVEKEESRKTYRWHGK